MENARDNNTIRESQSYVAVSTSTSILGVVAEMHGHICWPAGLLQTLDTFLHFTAVHGAQLELNISLSSSAVVCVRASFYNAN